VNGRFNMHVQVLDDEPFMRKLLGHLLSKLDFTNVNCFESGAAALAAFGEPAGAPDLILLDLDMPGMDGIEFVRHLADRQFPGGVVLVSGEDSRMLQAVGKVAQSYNLSLLGALSKPPTVDGLKGLLKDWPRAATQKPRTPPKSYSAQALRSALANNELINYYQPKVEVSTRDVVGVESLIRWQHPTDGMFFPGQFIPLAEAEGVIGEITGVVLKQALAQIKYWQLSGLSLCVAINVSMDDFASLEFADFVAAETAAAGVSPQSLVLEVTESQLMPNLSTVLEVLTRLGLKRFRLSIDDFGTGHSSLVQLRDLPFDELKIDRSFTHQAAQDERLRAIFTNSLNLAKELGMEVVAEGVEDAADWEFLCSSGCQFAQGYYVGRPMPAAALQDWMADWHGRE
jgi:EAL domain-containing protein (putative c-di-GMP-specific phosphodiesterase class I)/ActR/RegA family two-component response regulator